jgi:hypothetical protein
MKGKEISNQMSRFYSVFPKPRQQAVPHVLFSLRKLEAVSYSFEKVISRLIFVK